MKNMNFKSAVQEAVSRYVDDILTGSTEVNLSNSDDGLQVVINSEYDDEYGDWVKKEIICNINAAEFSHFNYEDATEFERAVNSIYIYIENNSEEHTKDSNSFAAAYYEAAQEAIEEKYGCTGAFLEPSTQCGMGGIFLFADDMTFEGSADFVTGEEYIHDEDMEGFISFILGSFYPVEDEDSDGDDDDESEDETDIDEAD